MNAWGNNAWRVWQLCGFGGDLRWAARPEREREERRARAVPVPVVAGNKPCVVPAVNPRKVENVASRLDVDFGLETVGRDGACVNV